MKSGQKGFTVIETLLVLILIAILGFTGYYVWHSQTTADKTLNAASSEKLAAPVKKSTSKTSSAKAAAISAADASKLVSDFYSQVYQALGGGNISAAPDRTQEKALVQQDGTSNLLASYASTQGYDLLTCGQSYAPFSVTSTTVSGDKAVVKVEEAFKQSPVNFTVDVVNSSGLKIDAVNCPQ